MPLRGENIGTAYVRILADGDGLDESIRRQFDDAEPSVREAGEHNADAYTDAFDKQYRKKFKANFGKTAKDMFEESNKALTDSLVRLKLSEDFFGGREWKTFRKRLVNEFGDAGNLAGSTLEKKFRDSANLDGLSDAMANIGPEIRRAQEKIVRQQETVNKESQARQDQDLRNFFKGQTQMHKAMLDAQMKDRLDADRAFDLMHRQNAADAAAFLEEQDRIQKLGVMQERAYAEDRQRMLQEQNRIQRLGLMQTQAIEEDRRRTIKALTDDYSKLAHQQSLLAKGSRTATMSQHDLIRGLRDLRHRAAEANVDLNEGQRHLGEMSKQARLLTPNLTRLDDRLKTFSDTTGSAFGRGSRNNFINFFGSVIRNVLSLSRILPNLAGVAVRVGRTFGDAFTDAGGGVSGLVKGFGALGPMALSAAGGLAAIGIGAAAVILILGPLVALISGLVGIVAALAGALSFALVGGIVAVVGALFPLAAGLGVVVAAFATMDAQMERALGRSIRPLKVELKELGAVARDELFTDLEPQMNQFANALSSLQPAVRNIARGLRGAFDGWADDLDSPGFRRWVDQMGNVVPGMIRSLGGILSNTLGGIGGFFTAAAPFVRDFLNWLEDITQQFQDWANSAGGRKEIREFLRDAADSAKDVGGFLEQVGGFLGDIFDQGRGPGGDIFDDMADAIKRWRDYFNENPEALNDWFEDAKKLATQLGQAADSAGKLMDSLDDKEARENLRTIIGFVEKIIGFAATANSTELGFLPLAPLRAVGRAAEFVLDRLNDIADFVLPKIGPIDIGGIVTGEKKALTDMVVAFSGAEGMIRRAIGKVSVAGIIVGAGKALVDLVNTFDPSRSRILRTIGKVSVANIIVGAGVALVGLVNTFNPANSRIVRAIGKVNVANIIVGAGVALVGLVNTFSGAAGKILNKIGKVNVSGIITGAGEAIAGVLGSFAGLGGRILGQIGHIDLGSLMHGSIDPPGPLGPWSWAEGGIADREMIRRIGEDGPEAVVPLNRPLSQVDPSVRMLSAFAQGMATPGQVEGKPGKTIDASGWQIITPTSDARAVANEVVDQLVGAAM